MNDKQNFKMEREFAASPEQLWRAWTEDALLAEWYGPGVTTINHKLDVREGGEWLVEMRMGDNGFFQRGDYVDVIPNQRLSWINSSTDADWQITANPMMPDWPKSLMTTVEFIPNGDKTQMIFEWKPHQASPEEMAAFAAAAHKLGGGWGSGFDILQGLVENMS